MQADQARAEGDQASALWPPLIKTRRIRAKRPLWLLKLNPRGFIGGFDRPEITCRHGDSEKRSIPRQRK
jgi:hypothetical protein